MLEIKITAPELSEAINNLAKALITRAETTPNGKTSGAVPTSTTSAPAEASGFTPVSPSIQQPTAAPATGTMGATATPTASIPVHLTQPAASVPNAAPVAPVPTGTPQYTLAVIAKAGTALIDAGKMDDLTALLSKYNVEALTALDPALYGVFASELRALGASI